MQAQNKYIFRPQPIIIYILVNILIFKNKKTARHFDGYCIDTPFRLCENCGAIVHEVSIMSTVTDNNGRTYNLVAIDPANPGTPAATSARQDAIITLLTPTYHAPAGALYTVGNVSKTIATLIGTNIPDWVRQITLVPQGTGIYLKYDGAADINSIPLGLTSRSYTGTAASLAGFQFFATSDTQLEISFTGI